jgi:phosphoglycolate phosphatase-like HAD superfamily hydrolase
MPKGVIFDMDGTLIEQNVDFVKLGREICKVADNDIIGKHREDRDDLAKAMANVSIDGQRKIKQIIGEECQRALGCMAIQEGGPELVAFLAQNGVRRAVLTRNYESNALHMQQMYFDANSDATFDLVIGRDTHYDGIEPLEGEISKSERILYICELWGCSPSEVVMVGDSIKDDILEGNRAGASTVLLEPEGYLLNYVYGTNSGNLIERKPNVRIESLLELKLLLEEQISRRSLDCWESTISIFCAHHHCRKLMNNSINNDELH